MTDTPMTEYQGEQIIRLLEQIEGHLGSIKRTLDTIDRTADRVVSELSDISHNTNS